jgi:hypothetical protein
MGNAIVFKQNVTYFSPELKARYFTPLRKSFGLVASPSYWTSKVKGNREHRLTPECGLSYAHLINVTYGYNFPISEYRLPFISEHRISILFTVF